MATKKATAKKTSTASVKKAAPKKAAATTTTVRTVKASDVKPAPVTRAAVVAKPANDAEKANQGLLNIVLAEIVGTFILTLVVLSSATDILPLFVGLTLALLVMTIGAVSGSHVNPAVTFGLWVAGKVQASKMLFYWAAQFFGAMAAFVTMHTVAQSGIGLDFSHFANFSWSIFFVELIGTAVFLFGLISVVSRDSLSATGKALGVGASLLLGVLVSSSLYAPVVKNAQADYSKSIQTAATEFDGKANQPDFDRDAALKKLQDVQIPQTLLVGGATLNPAVALAVTEAKTAGEVHATAQISVAQEEAKSSTFSRLTLEVIAGTLVGAAIGAFLVRLVNYRFSD